MHTKRLFSTVIFAFALFRGASAYGKDTVILRFNFTNGTNPVNSLIADSQGNLYGTALGGNTFCYNGCGVVYELSPIAGGKWKETVLYEFDGSAGSGGPGPMIFGQDGNLYGTISYESVFQLSNVNGTWKEKIIYTFNSQTQGGYFGSQLAFDDKGNLYGALRGGGPDNGGAIFKLTLQSNGNWKAAILHSFGAEGDGNEPAGGVVLDDKGNIFGTTSSGGSAGTGTVFELSPSENGEWSETILYNFTGEPDISYPSTPLTIGPGGGLFGTTYKTAFEMSQNNDSWSLATIYFFGKTPTDVSGPSGLIFDASGNAFGVTTYGGEGCNVPGCGILFQLVPQSNGHWKETILHQFESAGDGSEVNFSSVASKLLLDNATGRLYGATPFGGDVNGDGTAFFVTP
jgi:uncharacterized repeat protein (TIGR03803 family)